jgi:prepilin-type processing-associated H-X9-DG protein
VRLANLGDGPSKTLAVSECLRGQPFIRRFGLDTAGYFACVRGGASPDGPGGTWRGLSWFLNQRVANGYFNTVFSPNDPASREAECEQRTPRGASAARSRHKGGVNVAYADGSARFMSDDVDLDIWRALSTAEGDMN